MKNSMFAFLFMALFVFPVFGQAEETRKADKQAIAMEDVVVTAGRVEEKKKDITTNVTIINEEEITLSSAKDLGDLLAEKNIGHIQKYPGGLTSIGIRGFRTESHGNDLEGHVLILVNGRRAGTGNAAKIATKNIERVEIIRGPASVQYGSAAMGGVVNVITRKGKGKPSVFVEGIVGSFDHKEGSLGVLGKVRAFDFSGSFTKKSRDDYKTGNGDEFHNTGYDSIENAGLSLGYEFFPGNRVGIIYNGFDADQVGSPDYISRNDLDDYKDSSNKSIDLIYDGKSAEGFFSWKAGYFQGKDKDKWINPTESNPDGWDNGIPSEQNTDQKGAQAQISLNWEDSRVTAGFDWVNYEIEATWDPKKSEYDNPAYFLLAKTKVFDQRLIMSGGLRYDKYQVEMKEGQGGKESDHNLSPRVGMAYLIMDNLKLRANYGEAFKMPSAKQLAGDFPGWFGNYVGNPNLDPEKSTTCEGGLDFFYNSFDSSLTFFHTDFKDKIQTASTPGGDTTWENVGKAEMEGIEGVFSYDLGTRFSWGCSVKPYASFVYLTKYKDKETDEDLEYTSDVNMSYGIAVSDLYGFSADLNFAYTGKQYITDFQYGTYQTIEQDSFTVANFTICREIVNFNKYGGLTIKGEIRNLFEEDYEYVQGYPMPGRSFFVGLRYDY